MSKPSLKELQQKVAELTEALQRERADSLNLLRRVEEERAKLAGFYKAMVVRELLPVVDNCERLLEHVSAVSKDGSWKQGAEQIVKQIHKILVDLGVERIKTVGEHFDPHLHEAVHMEGADGEHEIISEELQPGYKIGDEVIRPALVKVKKEKK